MEGRALPAKADEPWLADCMLPGVAWTVTLMWRTDSENTWWRTDSENT